MSYALRGEGNVGARILAHAPSRICISANTLGELRYGAERRGSAKLRGLIDEFTGSVAVMPFDEHAALAFGKVATRLVAKGKPIGQLDTLIAAHAIALGVTLVTHNAKHFAQVDGLKSASWV